MRWPVPIRSDAAGSYALDDARSTESAVCPEFAYVKATEGTKYQSSTFSQQYAGARQAGLAHGAYHFATPNTSSGVRQADYFLAHGGGGKPDGHTLPGVLDRPSL